MSKVLGFALALLIALGLMACSDSNNNGNLLGNDQSKAKESIMSYQNIAPEAAKKLLESDEEVILVDVRTPAEYAEKHIPDSVLIPVDQLEKEASSRISSKDTQIIVYCRSGNRSVTAAKALVNMGYTKVYNLGGINAWPYDTENSK